MNNPVLELGRIFRAVSIAETSAEQVKEIVDATATTLAVDVSSLYLVNRDGDMSLIANYGLDKASAIDVILPAGEGLVGLTAKSLHPVNIADANNHQANYYIPGIDGGELKSFCGVPLVKLGKVIGVLVVQSNERRQFSAEDEAFLVTLAAQLAQLKIDIPESKKKRKIIRVQGLKGAPGIAVGRVKSCDTDFSKQAPDVKFDNQEAAIAKWHELLEEVKASIIADQQKFSGVVADDVSAIFSAYSLLISDPSLVEHVEAEIKKGHSLVYSIRHAIDGFAEKFLMMNDPYLRARSEDIHHIGDKLLQALRPTSETRELASEEAVVLVGRNIGVTDIAAVLGGQLVGIISGEGSSLSHVAVLANAMGIPAVMGVDEFKLLGEGEQIIVDGNRGEFIVKPSKRLLNAYHGLINHQLDVAKQLAPLAGKEAISLDGQAVKLFANTGLLADIMPGLQNGADGVGLYRTEIPFMVHESFPSEEEQLAIYQQVINAYQGMPVYMRILDIGSDKQLPYFPITGEANPAMGWRGIRFVLDNSPLLMTQLRAMLRAGMSQGNLHLLIPMISDYDELLRFHQLLDEAVEQLNSEGYVISKPPVGIMVEVPAAISQFTLWQDKIDFVSIGSNDLSQYLLAVDRNNARVSERYDAVHPAVINEIQRVVEQANKYNLPVCVCGEMASDPVAVVLLLALGVRRLSISAVRIPFIKSLIRQISISDCLALLAEVSVLKRAGDIRECVEEFLDKQVFAYPTQ